MKTVRTTSSAIKAASRKAFLGADLRERVNSRRKGYDKSKEKRDWRRD